MSKSKNGCQSLLKVVPLAKTAQSGKTVSGCAFTDSRQVLVEAVFKTGKFQEANSAAFILIYVNIESATTWPFSSTNFKKK